MFLFRLCMSQSILLLVQSTYALYLADPPASINSLPASPPANELELVNVSSTTNISATTLNYAPGVGAIVDPVCNGSLLGFDMNRLSCLQAWNTIPTTSNELSFGNRSEGRYNVELPRRFSSRKCLISWSI